MNHIELRNGNYKAINYIITKLFMFRQCEYTDDDNHPEYLLYVDK